MPTGRPATRQRRTGAVLLLAAASAAGACTSDIPGQPDVVGAVVTYRAPGVAFGAFATYALASRVGLVTSAAPGKQFAAAPALLAAAEAHLQARGFVKVADVDPASPPPAPPAASLAVNVTALEAVGTQAPYWNGFAGYSQPADLGLPGYEWAYPWAWEPVDFVRGTLLVEITSLDDRAPGSPGRIPAVWTALAYGVAPGGDWDSPPVLEALDRAFAQSPYLATP